MRKSQRGVCACGCGRALDGAIIAEHSVPVALGNEAKPDCLLRADCAAVKTASDRKIIAHVSHLRLETGQQARRARRKAEGRPALLQTKPLPQGRGFDKRLTKGFDGKVRPRMDK
jgi:hypothetical protein